MLLKNSGRGNASYILAKRLAKLCPVGMWKAELVNDESGHLSRRFDKCCVEGLPGLFLVIIAKCKEEREKLRKEHKRKGTRT